MAQLLIGVGIVGNDRTGDYLRPAFIKVNENFSDLYRIINEDLSGVAFTGAWEDINNRPVLGTAAQYNVGTEEGNIVQVQADGRLPPLDGSQLTNIAGGGGGGGAIDIGGTPTANQTCVWLDNNTIKAVTPLTGGSGGQVLSKITGTDFDWEWVTSSGSLDATGTPTTGQIAVWNDSNTLEGVSTISYTLVSGLGTFATANISSYNFVPNGGTTGQVLAKIDNTNGNTQWVSAITSIQGDTTPTLGANLDLNGFNVGNATPADLVKLNEITASSIEINYLAGAQTNIQEQLDEKISRSSGVTTPSSPPLFVGDVYVDELSKVVYLAVGDDTIEDWTTVVSGAQCIKSLLETLPGADKTELLSSLGGLTEDDIEDATMATTSDINNNTSGDLLVTPNTLNASNIGKKEYGWSVFKANEAVVVGDGNDFVVAPASWNGMDIKAVLCGVGTKGITGATDVQLRRKRAGSAVDVLSTKVTIGDEFFAADGVINTSNDDIQTGDQFYVDVDAIHSGTAPQGLSITVTIGK